MKNNFIINFMDESDMKGLLLDGIIVTQTISEEGEEWATIMGELEEELSGYCYYI